MTEQHSTIERAARVATLRVTVIGLGAMGQPMAARLAAAGYDVAGVDPSGEARARVDGAGMTSYPDIASVPATDLVVVLVATGAQLLDAVASATGARSVENETWLLCSTVGPQAAQDAARLLSDAGAAVIDAPVTGGVPGAEQGTLRFLSAGDPEVIDTYRAALSVLGQVAFISDRPGDGQATKLVNQLCSSVHLAAAAEAIALARGLGLDPAVVIDALSQGAAGSFMFADRGGRRPGPGRPTGNDEPPRTAGCTCRTRPRCGSASRTWATRAR